MFNIVCNVSKDGRIQVGKDNALAWRDYCKTLSGKQVEVILRKPKKTRSGAQNRYYWGEIIDCIAEEVGYLQKWEKEGLHERLKEMFLPTRGRLKITQSTTELSTSEFVTYCEKIITWSSDFLKLPIRLPNEEEIKTW